MMKEQDKIDLTRREEERLRDSKIEDLFYEFYYAHELTLFEWCVDQTKNEIDCELYLSDEIRGTIIDIFKLNACSTLMREFDKKWMYKVVLAFEYEFRQMAVEQLSEDFYNNCGHVEFEHE